MRESMPAVLQLSGMHVLSNTWYSWSAAIGTGYYGDDPFDTAHFH